MDAQSSGSPSGAFRLRRARYSDIAAVASLYVLSFANDSLLDLLFPTRHAYPQDFSIHIFRVFQKRFWTPGYHLTLVVDAQDNPVGFSWCRRSQPDPSMWEVFFSPYIWIAFLIRTYVNLKIKLLPLSIKPETAYKYQRAFADVEKTALDTERKRTAWYIPSIGIHPAFHGRGLGSMILLNDVAAAEQAAAAIYLVSVHGKLGFYLKHGFEEVGMANTGALSAWDGGHILFRGL